jgi:hypothetical protein
VRVGTLVKEYLAAQELQLLGENGMSDAIQMFVDKDDIHAISTYVFFFSFPAFSSFFLFALANFRQLIIAMSLMR